MFKRTKCKTGYVFIMFNSQIIDGKMRIFTRENMYDLYKEIYMQW